MGSHSGMVPRVAHEAVDSICGVPSGTFVLTRTPSVTQAVVARENDGSGARVDPQFVEDAGEVIADGLFADEEPPGDVAIAQSFCDEAQDVGFPSRELLE